MPNIKFLANGGEGTEYLASPTAGGCPCAACGGLAIWAGATNLRIGAGVSYCYVLPHGKPDFSKIGGAALGHFSTPGKFVSLEDARALEAQLREAGVDTRFEYHGGAGHTFFNDINRLGTYDAAATDKSWERSGAFLHDRLGNLMPRPLFSLLSYLGPQRQKAPRGAM